MRPRHERDMPGSCEYQQQQQLHVIYGACRKLLRGTKGPQDTRWQLLMMLRWHRRAIGRSCRWRAAESRDSVRRPASATEHDLAEERHCRASGVRLADKRRPLAMSWNITNDNCYLYVSSDTDISHFWISDTPVRNVQSFLVSKDQKSITLLVCSSSSSSTLFILF